MKFTELESIMFSRGISTLAEIARALETTPQAVSNWKARDQVPYHIVAKISQKTDASNISSPTEKYVKYPTGLDEQTISLSDLLLSISQQLKLLLLIPFVTVFISFTYVKFIKSPSFLSWTTILLPEDQPASFGGLAGLASDLGVNIPGSRGPNEDLSSPSFFPDLLKSRTFAEKILDKEFYTDEFGQKLSLLSILTHGNEQPRYSRDTLINKAIIVLKEKIVFSKELKSSIASISVIAHEAIFAKELAEVVLVELENLSRYYKSQRTNEKITFINERILSVNNDLTKSEQKLKEFKEKNRQVSSPALQLEQERLERDLEIQKGVYLTLRQQLELVKIEQVQESSVVQVLDMPVVALGPFNINLKKTIMVSFVGGIGLGLLLALIRSFINSNNVDERRKIRRTRNFLLKKGKEFVSDRRISAVVSILLMSGLPFFLGHKSQSPVYFNMYSPTLMFVNTVYIIILIFSIFHFIYQTRKQRKNY